VLFLVDRSALGEQTANAYKDARLESLRPSPTSSA
jgi:type I site-specific restriction endonuclease